MTVGSPSRKRVHPRPVTGTGHRQSTRSRRKLDYLPPLCDENWGRQQQLLCVHRGCKRQGNTHPVRRRDARDYREQYPSVSRESAARVHITRQNTSREYKHRLLPSTLLHPAQRRHSASRDSLLVSMPSTTGERKTNGLVACKTYLSHLA